MEGGSGSAVDVLEPAVHCFVRPVGEITDQLRERASKDGPERSLKPEMPAQPLLVIGVSLAAANVVL
jgi:hypothetical protein